MSRIPGPPFERSEQDRVVAGVCGGIAAALGVDATLVRLVFALLALAGGAGILLYLALWVWTSGRRPVFASSSSRSSAMAILFALGFSGAVVLGIGLIVAGIVLLVRRGATLRPGGSFTIPGVALDDGRRRRDARPPRPARLARSRPGALAGALLLVLLPWTWQMVSASGRSGSASPSGRRWRRGSTTRCSRRSR